jgi:hypothetical protein
VASEEGQPVNAYWYRPVIQAATLDARGVQPPLSSMDQPWPSASGITTRRLGRAELAW